MCAYKFTVPWPLLLFAGSHIMCVRFTIVPDTTDASLMFSVCLHYAAYCLILFCVIEEIQYTKHIAMCALSLL